MAKRPTGPRSVIIAFATVAVATLIKLWLRDSLGRDAPFALLGLAVVVSGGLAGARAALVASLFSTLSGWYLFLSPYDTFEIADAATWIRLIALLCEGLIISSIVSSLDGARLRAERAVARVERLQSLTSALASAVTPADVALVTVQKGVEALAAHSGVFVQTRSAGVLELAAHHGLSAAVAEELASFPTQQNIPTAVAFQSGQPEWIESAEAYARRYPELSARLDGGYAASAALPLRLGERKLGAIAFRFASARRFSRADRELMQTLASQAAQAFERAQIFAAEVRSRARLEKLNLLMQALSTALTRSEVAAIVVDAGMTMSAGDTCTLHVPEADGGLRLIGDRGVSPVVLARIRRIASDSLDPVIATLRSGEALWAESEADYAALYPQLAALKTDGPRAHAFWSVPLIAEGEPVGLLGMGFYAPRPFPPEEREFVVMLARHCGQALRRAERLEAERSAREVEERLRNSFETTLRSIGDAVIATDTEGCVTLMNPVAEQLTGWPEAEARGRALREVFPILNERTRTPVESPVARVLKEGIVVGLANHTVLVHRDGRTETSIDDSGAPIRSANGRLDGVVLVFRDVSSKKRQETLADFLAEASAALAESLDYRATLARVARLAVPLLADWCAVDVVLEEGSEHERLAVAHVDETKILEARALGDAYPRVLNDQVGVSNVLRTGRSELYPVISDQMLQGFAIDPAHLALIKQLQLHSCMIVPLLARGRALGAMTFVWAESRRSYSVEDLAFAEDLAQRCAIAIDNAQLYAAEQRARQHADLANRSKDEFLAIMGHELRNPLAPMATAVQLLKLRSHDDDKEIAVLERQLRHMLRLLEDLLDLSRVLRDKLELSRQVVEIGEVVASAVEVARPLIDSRQQLLQLEVASTGLAVDVDPVRMAQVFGNLLTNAAKYTDRGGEIRVRAYANGSNIGVAIEDSGVGIEPELMPRLFELFSQGKQSIDRQLGGLGIGLAIASRLVKEHGGELTAYSDGPKRGSRFTVELPRAAANTAQAVIPPLPPPAASARKRVLIVDDNEDSGELMALLIEKLGHETRTAVEGTRALQLAEEWQPDIVFLDIGLPGMNGFEVARRMRQLPVCAKIPIVAVTGYTRDSDREQAASAGFSQHFAKPIGMDRLRGVLDANES